MNTAISQNKNNFKWASACLIIGLLFTSCKKEEVVSPKPEKEQPTHTGGGTPYYKLQRVENLTVETDDANPTVPPAAVLFSLETKAVIPLLYAKTNRWDICFNGLYNSFLSSNNGQSSVSLGAGSTGAGAIAITKTPFEALPDVPADATLSADKTIGTDDEGDFGEGVGWYLYDFAGTKRGDGSYQKQHVAYAMPEKRTIVVRTAKGDYAKIKMISCYKDAFTADKWFRSTPHMYFTFEFVIVPNGSTKFEIK
ncbi:HmuY family protein [uncultured Pedobacter sp.]|uniref:HmuY family protein n=1 Tax=uncultured Pedobacter sp. TaxID=246139 RepID=UPI0025DE0D10|nr:HmuY family protein [uncultured Pedobacter sp.]